MNEMQKDNFELLISAAVVGCVHQDADEFSATDTSAVPQTPRLYKKVMRNLPGRKRTTAKVIIAAALVAVFLALTACACITEIREYVWGVVTKWYGDHFEVSFEPEPVTTEEPETTASEAQYPTEIERVARLKYVPEGYYIENECGGSYQYMIRYSTDDDQKFVLIQKIYDVTKSYMNGKNEGEIFQKINEFEGVITMVESENSVTYCLIWQDDQYRYVLQGYFSSITELVRIAENVSLK